LYAPLTPSASEDKPKPAPKAKPSKVSGGVG